MHSCGTVHATMGWWPCPIQLLGVGHATSRLGHCWHHARAIVSCNAPKLPHLAAHTPVQPCATLTLQAFGGTFESVLMNYNNRLHPFYLKWLTHWGLVVHIQKWTVSSLAQVMAWRPLGTKPIPESILIYFQSDLRFIKIQIEMQHFSFE